MQECSIVTRKDNQDARGMVTALNPQKEKAFVSWYAGTNIKRSLENISDLIDLEDLQGKIY